MLNRFELEDLKKKKFSNLRELRNGEKSLDTSVIKINDVKRNFSNERSVHNKNFSTEKSDILNRNDLTTQHSNYKKRVNKSNDFASPRNIVSTERLSPLMVIEKNMFKKISIFPKIGKK